MLIQPLRDRIIVLPDPIKVTEAGIVLSVGKGMVESQSQDGRAGTVFAVGDEIDATQLKVGDRVLYGEFVFPEYREDSVTYLVMQDKDICGVIDE